MSDVSAVFAPGFYIFFNAFIIYSASYVPYSLNIGNQVPPSFWDILATFSKDVYTKPSSLFFIIFASYLFGIILRAIPVRWTEKIIPPFHSKFPYPDILNKLLETLKESKKSTKHDNNLLPSLSKELPMHVFNYWKYVLCMRAPDVFQFYQSFENRSRFFAGMILASLFGTASGIVMFFVSSMTPRIYMPFIVLSASILFIFGINFRRIRRQEARALFIMFIAFLQEGDRVKHDKSE